MKSKESHSGDFQSLPEIDRLVHEPARLAIMAVLYAVDCADFLFVMRQTSLTRGNLSSHMSKLEEAGYLEIKKEFVDKIPRTLLRITPKGRQALKAYRENMNEVLRQLPE
ncbi:MAG: transcriptional regulator [Candidatus Omnitrophota bacterium]